MRTPVATTRPQIEFVHYGSRFEVRFNGEASSALFQVFVDGAPTSATPYSITPASVGGSNLVPVTFSGGTKLRRIRLEFTRSVSLGGIIVASLDFIAAAGKHLQAQGLLIGDSYSDGANGVPSLNTYAYRLGKYLGCDLLIEGQGGTGFVAVSGSGKSRYIDRIISAYANTPGLNPDFVFLQGSVNDANGNEVNLPTYLLPAIAQVRAYWPRAKIIMNNLLFPSGVPGNGMTTASTNLKAAASKVDLFIDPVTEVWYGGNSNAASPNGSGNSDVLLSSDGLHPTQVGHDMMASVLARRIVDYFNTL